MTKLYTLTHLSHETNGPQNRWKCNVFSVDVGFRFICTSMSANTGAYNTCHKLLKQTPFHLSFLEKFGSFCRYRKALYFWSLGISLYLELFCFLSFNTIVLRNLCSGTHRRNQKFWHLLLAPLFSLKTLKCAPLLPQCWATRILELSAWMTAIHKSTLEKGKRTQMFHDLRRVL